MHSPQEKFIQWFNQAINNSPLQYKKQVCLSTVDKNGHVDARFVDVKEVNDAGVIFTTHYESKKANDIQSNKNVALTFWWEHDLRQVRIKGVASPITSQMAVRFWDSREYEAKLASYTFSQSKQISGMPELMQKSQATISRLRGDNIPRPEVWGGFLVKLLSIEFMEFKQTRQHHRIRYIRECVDSNDWQYQFLQP